MAGPTSKQRISTVNPIEQVLDVGSESEITWVDSTDVLVVGWGAAGASAAIEAREQGADVLVVDRFGGGGGHGNQTTCTPAQGFLNHFIARTAADQHESVARMSIPVKQRPDVFVHGIVPPDVFAQQHHLTAPIHPRRGVGRPCLIAHDLQPFKPRQHRVQQPDV